jgi:hypothetical protein
MPELLRRRTTTRRGHLPAPGQKARTRHRRHACGRPDTALADPGHGGPPNLAPAGASVHSACRPVLARQVHLRARHSAHVGSAQHAPPGRCPAACAVLAGRPTPPVARPARTTSRKPRPGDCRRRDGCCMSCHRPMTLGSAACLAQPPGEIHPRLLPEIRPGARSLGRLRTRGFYGD